jgi:hypothetical protein
MAYLLDANVFIAAKNLHYGLYFCPAFWEWLIDRHSAAMVFSVDKVSDEIQAGADDLSTWAAGLPAGFFLSPDPTMIPSLGAVSTWATSNQVRTGGDQYVRAGRRLLPRLAGARRRSHRRHARAAIDLDAQNQDPRCLPRPGHQVHHTVRNASP